MSRIADSHDIVAEVHPADRTLRAIQQLAPSIVNKIAAGEVIERPASVAKELIENSIDAGATRIDVTVEQGGLELIRVSDDGCGIAAEQLPLAVASHATSKIRSADDLFCVQTLGFRGEALASIAEVSRTLLRSRVAENAAGAQIEVSGGQAGEVNPCGCAVGTTVEVRNLFYNTPVRRKFLRSTQTEMSHIAEAFIRAALGHPQIHCTLRHNERVLYELPPADDWRQRIGAFFGPEIFADLIDVASNDGGVELSGYVASPAQSRANQRMQYLFLNGRAIRDRSLQHALGEAYRGLLLTGRYPIAFLRISMPAELVDVNVHPTKLEVRFQEGGRLYSQLLGTLRSRFLTTDLTPRLQTAGEDERAAAHDPIETDRLRNELVQWAKGQLETAGGASIEASAFAQSPGSATPVAQRQFAVENTPSARLPLDLVNLGRTWRTDLADETDDEPDFADVPPVAGGAAVVSRGAVPALQVHNRYLVTASDEGVIVIDQHALHERILYEHLRERVLNGAVESQQLLVPEPVDLAPAETSVALESREILRQLGIGIEPFGGDTLLVSSYPAMLANLRPAEVLRAVVERLLAGGKNPERRDLLDDLLHMIACKAAIKAGDRLSDAEISALLEQRHLCQDTHHCPHGRPTALVFTREELDRQFKRT